MLLLYWQILDPIESLPNSFEALDQSLLGIEGTTNELQNKSTAYNIDTRQQLTNIIVSDHFLLQIHIELCTEILFSFKFQQEHKEQRDLLNSLRHEYETQLHNQTIDSANGDNVYLKPR